MRVYHFTCRTCKASHSVTAAEDPGQQSCPHCPARTFSSWWSSAALAPFKKPDTTGMIFGPHLEEMWDFKERQREQAGGILPEDLTICDEEPAEAPSPQLKLL